MSGAAQSLRSMAEPGAGLGAGAEPQRLGVRQLWAAWKRVARRIGDFQARVLLTIFYFVLLAPFALIVRRTSDPLGLKAATRRGWGEREERSEYTLEMAHRQF